MQPNVGESKRIKKLRLSITKEILKFPKDKLFPSLMVNRLFPIR
jgi:hypothetical protein